MSTAAPPSPYQRWLERERRAWQPLERMRPSEWAAAHRYLSRAQSARPGPWNNAEAPYLVGLMDLCIGQGVRELNVMKAAQIGASEALRNVIGYLAHREPDPVLLVLPDENTGRKIMRRRILRLFRETPALRELFTDSGHDVQVGSITLANGFTLALGWSGSPATLASDPIRVVINDEVDKFALWSGREADPISLAHERTKTFEARALVVNVSTPTTRDGVICARFERSPAKLYYFVPCPYCGAYQRLTFDRLRWPDDPNAAQPADAGELPAPPPSALSRDDAHAEHVAARDTTVYRCADCAGEIPERAKPGMLARGTWAASPDDIDAEGRTTRLPPLRRTGVHLSALYARWVRWADIAAEFLRSRRDPRGLMNFRNSWLGEVFEQQTARPETPAILAKQQAAPPPGLLPDWASVILAAADTQRRKFYYVVRAWGPNYRSQRIDHGEARSFTELDELLRRQYPPATGNRPAQLIRWLAIDTGGGSFGQADEQADVSRTHELYRWVTARATRVKAFKGASQPQPQLYRTRPIHYTPPGQHNGLRVLLTLIDTGHFKDWLTGLMSEKLPPASPGGPEAETWALDSRVDPDYIAQLCSEHKVIVREGRGRTVERWVQLTAGAANHFWDCETYLLALAHMVRVDQLRAPPPSSGAGPKPPPIRAATARRARPPIRRSY